MPYVRIYKKEKTATQSGRARTNLWVAEFGVEALKVSGEGMNYDNKTNTNQQLRLYFDSSEKAENWAKQNKYDYRLIESQKRKVKPKSYADNFAYQRTEPWTH